MSALDEYSKGVLDKKKLQEAIFYRYADKYGSFVAENLKGSKRLFVTKYQRNKKNKNEMKIFRNFMNQV